MATFDKYKKLLSRSTTMPAGTAQGGKDTQSSTLMNMHTARGGGCGCCAGGHHHEEDEDEG